MSITQAELNAFVTSAQCCYATKMSEAQRARQNGDVSFGYKLRTAMTLNLLIFSIQDYDLANDTCLTEAEIVSVTEKINKICCDCC